MSVTIYNSTLRNIPEGCRSHMTIGQCKT